MSTQKEKRIGELAARLLAGIIGRTAAPKEEVIDEVFSWAEAFESERERRAAYVPAVPPKQQLRRRENGPRVPLPPDFQAGGGQ